MTDASWMQTKPQVHNCKVTTVTFSQCCCVVLSANGWEMLKDRMWLQNKNFLMCQINHQKTPPLTSKQDPCASLVISPLWCHLSYVNDHSLPSAPHECHVFICSQARRTNCNSLLKSCAAKKEQQSNKKKKERKMEVAINRELNTLSFYKKGKKQFLCVSIDVIPECCSTRGSVYKYTKDATFNLIVHQPSTHSAVFPTLSPEFLCPSRSMAATSSKLSTANSLTYTSSRPITLPPLTSEAPPSSPRLRLAHPTCHITFPRQPQEKGRGLVNWCGSLAAPQSGQGRATHTHTQRWATRVRWHWAPAVLHLSPALILWRVRRPIISQFAVKCVEALACACAHGFLHFSISDSDRSTVIVTRRSPTNWMNKVTYQWISRKTQRDGESGLIQTSQK